ncbi:MAG TPA: alpha/beta hydrolase [Candidatus Thermoplasmatota archaeon]|nr:alpha/beta hydrolase [Candidatus Thermoplasmatota archaeon]
MDLDLPHTDHGPRAGLPILLLHGFPLDHGMWAAQERALAAAGFRVLAPDLRGMGKAPPGKGPGSMGAYAGDVLRLADRAGLRRFALAGFSMGGYVAFEVARRAPERLLGLALVDTRMEPDSEEGRRGRAAMMEKVRQQGPQALVDAMLSKMLSNSAPSEAVERVRATMMRTPIDGAVQALEAMAARPDSTATLRGLACPVLVVVGEQDALTPPDAARAMAQAARDARLVVVPGAHLTPVESPDAVAEAMLAWARGLA